MRINYGRSFIKLIAFSLTLASGSAISGYAGEGIRIKFINCTFENASPLSWTIQGDTATKVSLPADYERESLNRQTDHWHFRLEAEKGTRIKLIISKLLPDVYNGREAASWWNFKNDISCYISYDRKSWEAIGTRKLPGYELLAEFTMKEDSVYIARMPPYTVTDLENLKKRIGNHKMVRIFNIGYTIEKRLLEIIRLGDENAPYSVIIRARAHPWEAGGNWVVEGLINEFLTRNSRQWQETFCIYIMPMAAKDGVARGMTRFNLAGKDLNRNWDRESDPTLCPEKYAFEKFVSQLIDKGKKPSLAIDFHNDDAGGINLAPHDRSDSVFIKNMGTFEALLRKHTSFSENIRFSWKDPDKPETHVSFENGMYSRYGIEAMVYELNANWIGNLEKMPSQYDWMETGKNLNLVFYEYLRSLKLP
jgi:hypothetical protein